MKIKNPSLAGMELGLKYGTGTVTGDADGVFDVPDKDAEFLLSTPGWAKPKMGRSVAPAAPEPAPEPEPEPAAVEPEPAPEPASEPEMGDEGDDAADEGEEGPDLEAMTKAELLACAAEYGVDDVDAHMRKDDIKAAVEAALFEDEGE
jgi:hypothetical protein